MLNVNDIQLKINDSLIFRRFEKIDWKQIASLNMDHLKTSSDWHVIEENLSNILCCHLESEFNRSNLDPNLCKLFQLAQISIDYLLQIRQQTLKELKACQDQVQDSKSALNAAIKAKEHAEKKLKEWKKESKKSVGSNQQQYYRCPACPKSFLNGDYLHGHWQRRHPEYVTIIPSTTLSPVGKITSSPSVVTTPDPPLVPKVDEIHDLKLRLQSAEKQLQNENQLLHSILEKMDYNSSIHLQGMLSQEVEKIRASILEEKSQSAMNSPQKIQSSISVQTTPRMFEHSSESLPPEENIPNQATKMHNFDESTIATPSPSIRSVYTKAESVKLIRQVTKQPEEEENSLASQSGEEDDDLAKDKASPFIQRQSPVKKPVVINKVNRQLLMNRFKSTIEKTLLERMRMLGIDTQQRSLATGIFRQLSEKVQSKRRPDEFQTVRRQFQSELKERLSNRTNQVKNKPLDETFKSPKPPLVLLSTRKESGSVVGLKQPKTILVPRRERPIQVSSAVTPLPRAPVPTPRSTKNQSGPASMNGTLSLMARDGEAPSGGLQDLDRQVAKENEKAIKDNPSLTLEGQEVVQEPIKETRSKEEEEENENDDDHDDDDSFSLSSLDAILAELKKPNRSSTATTPSLIKSVQWRVPVETEDS